MDTVRDRAADFFECLQAEIDHQIPFLQGVLVFGSYTRAGNFGDIDIVGVLGGVVESPEELEALSVASRRRLDYVFSEGERVWHLPPFQNQGYFPIIQSSPRDLSREVNQMDPLIRKFYEFYAAFNRQPQSTRVEMGIEKLPADFRFSPDHVLWRSESSDDRRLHQMMVDRLRLVNLDYQEEVARYAANPNQMLL